jgi:hypothetical protein
MVKNLSIAAAPRTTTEVSARTEGIMLTIIESASRRAVFVDEVDTRKQALAIFRAFGDGYDVHIRTPSYSELILSKVKCGSDSFSPAGSVKDASITVPSKDPQQKKLSRCCGCEMPTRLPC